MADLLEKTEDWKLYEDGKNYLRKINHYETVNKNFRFYSGDQWHGVQSNGLPTPVFNFIKRVIDYKISSVMSNDLGYNFEVVGLDVNTMPEMKAFIDAIKGYSKTLWENLKMHSMNQRGLLDAANSGSMISYWYFEPNIKTGQLLQGDIVGELIDSVNYLPGNPNDARINTTYGVVQPYIIIPFRMLVSQAREIARANGVSEESIKQIIGDTDNTEQAGDLSKHEIESTGDNSGKVTVLLKMWFDSETQTVWFRKSVKSMIIQDKRDTMLRIYPVAMMNWYDLKNCAYGSAEASGLIPNQIYVNKIAAMIQMASMYTSFPKPIYDKTRMAPPSNQIGTAIGVQGDITGAFKYAEPPKISSDAFNMFNITIETTKELMGATDAVLGNVKPENTSAIIAVQEAAAVPLENIKRRFWQYIEDVGRIWLEMWVTYYGARKVPIKMNDQVSLVDIDFSMFKNFIWNTKVDVGPSTQYSEIASINALDRLIMNKDIDIIDYLERIPESVIPKKDELIASKKQMIEQAAQRDIGQAQDNEQAQYEQMAQFLESLPKEVQSKVSSLPPEEMENHIKAMMQLKPSELQAHIQTMLGG
jgi:hypothetical protein